MRMPSYTALCSFVFSMILTSALIPSTGDVTLASAGSSAAQLAVQSALNGLRAEGFAGSAQLALPAPAVSPTASAVAAPGAPESALAPELLGKILKAIGTLGRDRNADADFAGSLGLNDGGQSWPERELVIRANPTDTTVHGFAINRGDAEDVLISSSNPENTHMFRAHRDGKIVAALYRDKKTHQITMRSPSEAQPELDAEIAVWAANVDLILAGK